MKIIYNYLKYCMQKGWNSTSSFDGPLKKCQIRLLKAQNGPCPLGKCDFVAWSDSNNQWMLTGTTWVQTGELSVKPSQPTVQHWWPLKSTPILESDQDQWATLCHNIRSSCHMVTYKLRLQLVPILYTQTTVYTYQSAFIPSLFYSWRKIHIIVFTYDPHICHVSCFALRQLMWMIWREQYNIKYVTLSWIDFIVDHLLFDYHYYLTTKTVLLPKHTCTVHSWQCFTNIQ